MRLSKAEKIELVKQETKRVKKAKGGYYIISSQSNTQNFQKYVKACKQIGISVKKTKLRLLEKILETNTLSGQLYLCVCDKPVSLAKILELLSEYKYYTGYSLRETVKEDFIIKAELTLNRPSPVFKQIQKTIPMKLAKGFIEVVDSCLINKGLGLTKLNPVLRELKLKPKPVQSNIYTMSNTGYTKTLLQLKTVESYNSGLQKYLIIDNGYMGYFNQKIQLLSYEHYLNIKEYLPTETSTLLLLLQYCSHNLLEQYGIALPYTNLVVATESTNLSSLLYLLYSSRFVKQCSGSNKLFMQKQTLRTVITEYYKVTQGVHVQLITELFTRIYTELTKTNRDQKPKIEQDEFDDLF